MKTRVWPNSGQTLTRLSPFFASTSMGWAIDHQYAFLSELFSGRESFFGDRPRNAHHWMVITDELFDHREALMETCLLRHGLPEEHGGDLALGVALPRIGELAGRVVINRNQFENRSSDSCFAIFDDSIRAELAQRLPSSVFVRVRDFSLCFHDLHADMKETGSYTYTYT